MSIRLASCFVGRFNGGVAPLAFDLCASSWRSWLASGRALGSRYRTASKRWPLRLAFGACFVKGSASDAVAQLGIEGRSLQLGSTDGQESKLDGESFSLRRNMAFALFSAAYLGCCQHVIYNIAFTRVFGSAQTLGVGIRKTIADVCLHVPFIYLPCYYTFQHNVVYSSGSASEGLRRLYLGVGGQPAELINTMRNYVKVFPGVILLNFTVIPTELRITTIACVSFVWLVILSTISHKYGEESNHDAESKTPQIITVDAVE